MIKNRRCVFVLTFVLIGFTFNYLSAQTVNEGCTIGVASGKTTMDGRPLIWKTRDNSSAPDNELVYNEADDLGFLEIISAGKTYAWMGVNEEGFAILNSLASDLKAGSSGMSNGAFMKKALGACATVAAFRTLLDETNVSGRKTHGNFAVLDSTGAAEMFEVSGNAYWEFNAADSLTAPEGYLIRTNFALKGDGVNGSGYERFSRSSNLIHSFYNGDSLNYRSIIRYQMRDFSDYDSQPVPVPFPDRWLPDRPYGYIYTGVSICRASSVSAAVIQGILAGEAPELTTMWTLLGQPAASIATPYWPVGATPAQANGSETAPLCDKSLQIKAQLFDYSGNNKYIDSYKLSDGKGGGLWANTFSAEDSVFTGTETKLALWRRNKPSASELRSAEQAYAAYALETLTSAYNDLITGMVNQGRANLPETIGLLKNYPNPFNMSTKIEFSLSAPASITIKIFNMQGREIAQLISGKYSAGKHTLIWNASEYGPLSSGLYFARLTVFGKSKKISTGKLMLIK